MLDPKQTGRVLADVLAERTRQHAAHGQQDLPDGTGSPSTYYGILDVTEYRARCSNATDYGWLRYSDILLEEVAEVLTETDQDALRAELVQVAAVCVQWVEAIDRRRK